MSPKALSDVSLAGASSEAASPFPFGPEEEVGEPYDRSRTGVKQKRFFVFASHANYSRAPLRPRAHPERPVHGGNYTRVTPVG